MQADTTDNFYNVGTGKRTSLKELAEMLIDLTQSTKPINYAERSTATLVRNRIGSAEKARDEIRFSAEIELRAGLEKIIAWRAAHKGEVEARRNSAGFQA
jgi:UDP-glucose 4-epimerase